MSNSVVKRLIERAQKADRHIVLPEAQDVRILQAAEQIIKKNYAKITLLGNPDDINALATQCNANINEANIVNHMTDERRPEYIEKLYEKRKNRGMTRKDADKTLSEVVYYAGMMVGDNRCDGMVAGSICPTSHTVRSALFGVGLTEGNKTVCSCSVMITIIPEVGVDGTLIFADTGVLPEPTIQQLADIGIAAAETARKLLDVEPIVAMLSFSTKGSATSPAVEKVIAATKIINEQRGDLKVDGELQLDAAIIPSVARTKAKNSPVAGKANILIFPDLSCGNIAYKLVERLGKASALGPLLLGTAKPVNDLSRGCSVENIVLITAITAVQAL